MQLANGNSATFSGNLTFTVNDFGDITGGQLDVSGFFSEGFMQDCNSSVGPNSSFAQNGIYTMNISGCPFLYPIPVATSGLFVLFSENDGSSWINLQPDPTAHNSGQPVPPSEACVLESSG